jgi:ATP-dependent RNA helicase RhlE
VFDFDTLGLGPTLNDALKAAGFTTPTPIQNKAVPLALEGT